jgi:hypothetical protein
MTNGRVYRTTSGGGPLGWVNVTGALPIVGVSAIAIDAADGNTAYVALAGFGTPHLFKTTNALSAAPTWTAIATGLPDTPVNAVAIDPDARNVLYAGTDVGIFRSQDGGSSWGLFMQGHPNVPVYDLVADSATGSLVSFTYGRGAYRLGFACTPPEFGGVGSVADVSACAPGLQVGWAPPTSWGQGASGGTFGVIRYASADCSGSPTTVASALSGTTTTFLDSGAPAGATVTYRVVATNNCGTPASSNGTVACSAPVIDTTDTTPCGPVGNSLLLSHDAASAELAWSAVACTDLASYEVYGATTFDAPFPGGWTPLGTPSSPAWTDSVASPWVAYRVIAVDDCGNPSSD